MSGYATIKRLAQQAGCSPEDLLCMARKNDPFYSGSKGQIAVAEWFHRWWQRFGFGSGVHLRRMHYALVSTEGATRADGRPYQNTLECWDYLCSAGKHARYQQLVAPTAFVDRRNPDPRIHGWTDWYGKEPKASVYQPEWKLPEIATELEWNLDLPEVRIEGYEYEWSDQPYTLALYVEKSTMDDVLLPLCQRLGVTYITSLGFQSITTIIQVLRHSAKCGRPVRMFYVSDFDPAGDFMPASVARQVEYWRDEYAPGVEIKLQPIVLTAAQVSEYRLPPIPVKESDLRRAGFEARYGVSGATELDALEAIHPGVLGRIVTEAIAPYHDPRLEGRIGRAGERAKEAADAAWQEATAEIEEELEQLRDDAQSVIDQYQERLAALAAEFAGELEPVRAKMTEVQQQLQAARRRFEVDLPERPAADTDATNGDVDEQDWLFDSNRGYMQQLRVYKARKAGDGNGNGHEEE